METLAILAKIFEVCIIPLLGALTAWLISFIKAKRDSAIVKSENELADKYITMLSDTISECVIATNQTYVEALKKDGKFDLEAQKKALELTYNNVMGILTEEAKMYLQEIYSDLQLKILSQIEAQVNCNKL